MKKYRFYLVKEQQIIRYEMPGDVVVGYWAYRSPFDLSDESKTYILNGYAIGRKKLKALLKDGKIQRITKKEAADRMFDKLVWW